MQFRDKCGETTHPAQPPPPTRPPAPAASTFRSRRRTSREVSATRTLTTITAPTTSSQVRKPTSSATGPVSASPTGPRDERADHVEGVDPRQLVRGHLLLDRQVPADAEDLQPEPVQERAHQHHRQRVRQRHRDREGGGEREEPGADVQRAPRLPAQRDQPADDEAEHHRRQGPAPGRPPERVADHDRAEHALRAAVEQVVEQRLQDQQPEPGVPHHLGEALADVGEHAPALRRYDERRDAHQPVAGGRERERERVDRQRPAAPGAGHEQPGRAAAHDHGDVLADPAPGDRGPEQLRGHGLLGDRRRARAAECPESTVDHAEAGEERDARPAADQRRGDQTLRDRGERRRALHHHGARQPVAEHSPEQHRSDVGQGVEADHDTEVGRVAAEVEHRERERDRRDAVAEGVHGDARQQPAVRRVAQRVVESRCHVRAYYFASELFVNEILRA